MIEWRHIIRLYDEVKSGERNAALATVVQIQGSSYRSTGSRMLIVDDGRWAGTISGGCLEKDACIQASMVMYSKAPSLVTYDSSRESDQAFMARLGCNGIIDVLFEPLDKDDLKIKMLTSFLEWQKAGAIATVYRSDHVDSSYLGTKMILNPDGIIKSLEIADNLAHKIEPDLRKSVNTGKSFNKIYQLENKSISVLIELIQPTIHLYVFGGGYDVHPLLKQAVGLGWKNTLCLRKQSKAKSHLFPDAEEVVLCDYRNLGDQLLFQPFSAAIVMCHNYEHDLSILEQLLQTEISFIGLLGPKKRANEMLEVLKARGIQLSEEKLSAIHAPVGLDIGAEGPVEIALSIITEILADFKGHKGGFLKQRKGPIHDRKNIEGFVFRNHYVEKT
jgi:xanthine/CO dehydrogenase XdhC/CoxF family maturation factor